MQATVVLSVLSSIFYGASDFFAGWAVRRLNVLKATTIAYAASAVVVGGVLLLGGWALSAGAVISGATSGVVALIGFVTGYAAMAIGPMSLLSPAVALIEATIPISVACITGHLLSPVAWLAIGIGLTAIVLIAMEPAQRVMRLTPKAGILALVSGVSLGMSVVALNFSPRDSGLLPAGVEAVTGLVLLCVLLLGGKAFGRRHGWLFGTPADGADSASSDTNDSRTDTAQDAVAEGPIPSVWSAWLLSLGGGVLSGAGNSALLLALHGGSLAIVSVLASLYPLGTVLLAAVILRERIIPRQATGIGLAVLATVMLSIA
jgi:EamA-like transporter family